LRMTVTKATGGGLPAFDLNVHSAPDGASDCWLLMGDSITNISTLYAFDDIPKLVSQMAPTRWPAIVPAAIGGTNTVTAQDVIDDNLKYFPGRFVTLNYGTNNHASDFDMEPLIQKVLAAGKIPVIPLMPWSDSTMVQTEAPAINLAIQALYQKYPQIIHGPDMWTVFKDRLDLIPDGDVHPNNDGQVEWRKQWAKVIAQ
ncbi:MAG: SGNH/GDSL hydrolase family protein, partial [Polyangiaceae bacterium]